MRRTVDWTTDRILFRTVVEAAGLMAWITEDDGYCIYLSPKWYNFTGTTPAEGEGFGWLDALHPDDMTRTRQTFFKSNDARSYYGIDYRLCKAGGGFMLVWSVGLPRHTSGGKFDGYFGMSNSIDHYKEQVQLASTGDRIDRVRVLTNREREVIKLISEGNTTEAISAMLGIAARTVDSHVASAATKLGAANRVHVVAKAMKLNEI